MAAAAAGAACEASDSCSGRLRWVVMVDVAVFKAAAASVWWVVVLVVPDSTASVGGRDPAESRLKMFNENSVFCVGWCGCCPAYT